MAISRQSETLGDYLAKVFPDIITKNEAFYQIAEKYSKLKIYCHGIECDLNMPLLYFYQNFYYFDGFTYLVIKF